MIPSISSRTFRQFAGALLVATTAAATIARTQAAQPQETPATPAQPPATAPVAPATPATPAHANRLPIDPALTLVGKPAPDFTLPDQNDKPHTLKDSRGKWTVVAFYPADMTQGCTLQNISYTRTSDKFAPLNAIVYTISTQDTASKKAFCTKDSLTHTLLADVGGKTAQTYNVLHGTVARRVTFYIAPDGTIKDVETRINTANAGEDSLAILKKLQEPATAAPAK